MGAELVIYRDLLGWASAWVGDISTWLLEVRDWVGDAGYDHFVNRHGIFVYRLLSKSAAVV